MVSWIWSSFISLSFFHTLFVVGCLSNIQDSVEESRVGVKKCQRALKKVIVRKEEIQYCTLQYGNIFVVFVLGLAVEPNYFLISLMP